jgi:hypothetical protein
MIATLLIVTWFGLETPEQMCFESDIKALCCPGACAAKNSRKWSQANDVLRGCMRGLGCKSGVDTATVGMRCDCPSK